jgi:hypothetical protein
MLKGKIQSNILLWLNIKFSLMVEKEVGHYDVTVKRTFLKIKTLNCMRHIFCLLYVEEDEKTFVRVSTYQK